MYSYSLVYKNDSSFRFCLCNRYLCVPCAHVSTYPELLLYSKAPKMSAGLCGGHLLSSLGVEHFNEQVVAGHVAVQMFVVEVLFGLQADRSDLRQPEEQLAELVRLLRVVAHDVVQERCVDLLLDTFYQVKVLQVLHIYRRKKKKR